MESRHAQRRTKSGEKKADSPLPSDFLKLICDVFTKNFDSGLKALAKVKAGPRFEVNGRIFADEVVLCVSLTHKNQLAATSVYASCDFDPKASSPTVQDLLNACVDAIGGVFLELLNDKTKAKLESLADESLSALENVPFEWTATEVDHRQVYVKIDKANPKLDEMADSWLRTNDPDLSKLEAETQRETEKLFVTGPRRKDGNGSGH